MRAEKTGQPFDPYGALGPEDPNVLGRPVDHARAIGLNTLEAARKAIEARGTTHGSADKHFNHVSELWSAFLGVNIQAHEVAIMMAMLKFSRIKCGEPGNADHYVDANGYTALANGAFQSNHGVDKVRTT